MALRRKPDEDGQLRLLEVDASMAGTLSFKDPVNLQINGQFEGSLDVRGVLTVGAGWGAMSRVPRSGTTGKKGSAGRLGSTCWMAPARTPRCAPSSNRACAWARFSN